MYTTVKRYYFITYSHTPAEPWLTEASANRGESRDFKTCYFSYWQNDLIFIIKN